MAQTRRWAVAAACVAAVYMAWQASQVARAAYPARYDYDEGVYAETAAAWAHGTAPYRDAFLSQPPAFIAALRAAFRLSGATIRTARITAVLASAIWLVALFLVAAAAGRPRAGLLALCAAAGNAAFSLASHTVQTDAPSEALSAAAVGLAVLGSNSPGACLWAWAGVAWGLALLTKSTAVVAFVPLALIALITPSRARGREADVRTAGHTLARPLTRLVALVLGAAAAAAPFLATIWTPAFLAQTVSYHLAAARAFGSHPIANAVVVLEFVARAWPLSAAAVWGAWTVLGAPRAVHRLLFARGGESNRGRGGAPNRVAGSCPSVARPTWLVSILLAWLALALGALVVLTPLWHHHLVLLISPLALLAGFGADAVLDRAAAVRPALATAASVCVTAAATIYIVMGTGGPLESSAALRGATVALARAVPPSDSVVTDDPMVPFLADRRVPPMLIDTSWVRIASKSLTQKSVEDALAQSDVGAAVLWRGTFQDMLPQVAECATALFPVVVVEDGPRRVLASARGRDTRAASATAGSCEGPPPRGDH